MRLWESNHKGDVHDYEEGMSLTCTGEYFNWPWWKRRLSDLAHNPYSIYRGLRGVLRRLREHRHLMLDWHDHEDGAYAPIKEMYAICYSQASSRIKPIFWSVDLSEYKKRKAEEPA